MVKWRAIMWSIWSIMINGFINGNRDWYNTFGNLYILHIDCLIDFHINNVINVRSGYKFDTKDEFVWLIGKICFISLDFLYFD